MKIEPRNIQVGDRVTVSGTITLVYADGEVCVAFDGTGVEDFKQVLSFAVLAQAEITRPEKPLAAGDAVTHAIASGRKCRLLFIDEKIALIRLTVDDEVFHFPVPPHELTRIEEPVDEAKRRSGLDQGDAP